MTTRNVILVVNLSAALGMVNKIETSTAGSKQVIQFQSSLFSIKNDQF